MRMSWYQSPKRFLFLLWYHIYLSSISLLGISVWHWLLHLGSTPQFVAFLFSHHCSTSWFHISRRHWLLQIPDLLWPTCDHHSNVRSHSHFGDCLFWAFRRFFQNFWLIRGRPSNQFCGFSNLCTVFHQMGTIQCYSCKNFGHYASHCKQKFCNYCKVTGHIISECRKRPRNRNPCAYHATTDVASSDALPATTFLFFTLTSGNTKSQSSYITAD